MLLESSKKGAEIDLDLIPYPNNEKLDLTHWLKLYQGCGFVVTCKPQKSKKVLDKFSSVGLTGKVVGEIIEERRLVMKSQNKAETLFDFTHESITGI